MIDHQLIDIKRGKADRDKGMKLAAWGRADILNEARAMAKMICISKGSCTIDDVRVKLDITSLKSNQQNWLGSVFRDPQFLWTGEYRQSAIPSNHARPIKVWRFYEKKADPYHR